MAHHDLADNLAGFRLGVQIELVNIRSLTPRSALLKPWSWQVATGWERVAGENGNHRLVPHLNGGGGFAWQPRDSVLGYSLATLRLEHHRDFDAPLNAAAGFNLGLLWRNPLGSLLAEGRGDYFDNGEVRRSLALAQQWELSRNLGLRLQASREFSQFSAPQTEFALQLRWYQY